MKQAWPKLFSRKIDFIQEIHYKVSNGNIVAKENWKPFRNKSNGYGKASNLLWQNGKQEKIFNIFEGFFGMM